MTWSDLIKELTDGFELHTNHDKKYGPVYHDGRRIELAQLLERLHPIHARHLHIEKNQMRAPLLVFGNPVGGVCEGVDLVPLVLEELSQCRADSLLIVDDENPATHLTLL